MVGAHGPDFHVPAELLPYTGRNLIRIAGGRDYDGIHRMVREVIRRHNRKMGRRCKLTMLKRCGIYDIPGLSPSFVVAARVKP